MAFLLPAVAAAYTAVLPNTELDWALYGFSNGTVQEKIAAYMSTHNLTEEQMVDRLNANFFENYTNSPSFASDLYGNAKQTLGALRMLPSEYATKELEKYSCQEFDDRIRSVAINGYLAKTGLSGLAFASNIVSQPWRTGSEHNRMRMEYHAQAMSALPADREKYIEFFKWAASYYSPAGFKTYDRQLNELDSTWRTNEQRLAAIQAQMTYSNTPTGTNILIELLRDYEIATGIRKLEPLPVAAQVPETSAKTIPHTNLTIQPNANNETFATAVSVKSNALSPVENNTSPSASIAPKRFWVLAAPIFLAALAFAVFLRRHQGQTRE